MFNETLCDDVNLNFFQKIIIFMKCTYYTQNIEILVFGIYYLLRNVINLLRFNIISSKILTATVDFSRSLLIG